MTMTDKQVFFYKTVMEMNTYPRPLYSRSYFVTRQVRQTADQLMVLYRLGTRIAGAMCMGDICCASQSVYTLAGAATAWLTGSLPAFDSCTIYFMCTCGTPKIYSDVECDATCLVRTIDQTTVMISDFYLMPTLSVIRVPFPATPPFWPCYLKEKPTAKDLAHFRKVLYLFMNFVTSRFDLPVFRSAIRPMCSESHGYGSPINGYYVNNTASSHIQDKMSLPHVLRARKEVFESSRLECEAIVPTLAQLAIGAAFK